MGADLEGACELKRDRDEGAQSHRLLQKAWASASRFLLCVSKMVVHPKGARWKAQADNVYAALSCMLVCSAQLADARQQTETLRVEHEIVKNSYADERHQREIEARKHSRWETALGDKLRTANQTIQELHASLTVVKSAYEKAGLQV